VAGRSLDGLPTTRVRDYALDVVDRRRRISVIVVDDHFVVRQGLRRVLEQEADVEVVGDAGDGASALRLAQRLLPDVVIMDVTLPGLNGIEATRRLVRERRCAVLVVTANGDPRTLRRSLRAGAKGILLKTCNTGALLSAVRAVARGEEAIAPDIMRILRDASEDAVPEGRDPLDRLSSRELEVLQLIGEGKTSPEIATALSVGRTTVESHRKRIMRKLGLHNHAELTRFALRERLTT